MMFFCDWFISLIKVNVIIYFLARMLRHSCIKKRKLQLIIYARDINTWVSFIFCTFPTCCICIERMHYYSFSIEYIHFSWKANFPHTVAIFWRCGCSVRMRTHTREHSGAQHVFFWVNRGGDFLKCEFLVNLFQKVFWIAKK